MLYLYYKSILWFIFNRKNNTIEKMLNWINYYLMVKRFSIMTKKRKKGKSRNKVQTLIISALIISGLLYILSYFWTKVNTAFLRTSILQIGKIEKSVDKEGVIVRNQAPIVLSLDGNITLLYDSGQRVAKNEIIAKVSSSDSDNNDIEKLEILEKKISQLKSGKDSMTVEYTPEYIDVKIDQVIREIQRYIQSEDYLKVCELKSQLGDWTERKKIINGIGDINHYTLEQLEEEKRILQNSITSNKGYIRASMAGLVSPYKDEYDDVYTFDNMMNLLAKQLKDTIQKVNYIDSSEVKAGDVLCYIVENHGYYIACELDSKDTQIIKRDKKLTIRIDGVDLPAYFYDFYKDSDGRFVGLFYVESDEYNFLANRKRHIEVIYQSETGILIPNNSILEYNGRTGVFVIDAVGIARFKELDNIVTSNEEYSLIYFDYNQIKNSKTINLYDEVILTTEGIEEGRRIR